jgi:hypothetical protein
MLSAGFLCIGIFVVFPFHCDVGNVFEGEGFPFYVMKESNKDLIAPCGMNCGICSAYLAYSRNIPRKKARLSIASDAVLATAMRIS